jgi:hypothetical protein
MTRVQRLKQPIRFYLRTAYTYERLVALLAHMQDGKFRFMSCCCIKGAFEAEMAAYGILQTFQDTRNSRNAYLTRVLIAMVKAELRVRDRARASAGIRQPAGEGGSIWTLKAG